MYTYICVLRFMYVHVYFTLFRYVHTYVRTWVHLQTHTYVCISSLVSSIHTYIYFTRFCAHTELCAHSRIPFVAFVILGVLTFGISLLIWFIYLKCRNDEKGRHVWVHILVVCRYIIKNQYSLLLYYVTLRNTYIHIIYIYIYVCILYAVLHK